MGLAAQRLRATVNLGSNKKSTSLNVDEDVDQGERVGQGWGLDEEYHGCAVDTGAVFCTERERGNMPIPNCLQS